MKVDVPLWQAYRLLEPGPVTLLTSRYRDRINVMAAAWVAPISYQPPFVGVAISPARLTHDLIRRSGVFALNIPGRPLAEQTDRAGTISGHDLEDKLVELGLTPTDAQEIDVPLIEECLAHLECAVVDALDLGDHTLFVAEVVAAQAEAEAFDEVWLLPEDEELRPLLHLGGNQYALLHSPISVERPKPGEG